MIRNKAAYARMRKLVGKILDECPGHQTLRASPAKDDTLIVHAYTDAWLWSYVPAAVVEAFKRRGVQADPQVHHSPTFDSEKTGLPGIVYLAIPVDQPACPQGRAQNVLARTGR